MKGNRKDFLNILSRALDGVSSEGIIEQSNSFVFKDKKVITFNDDLCVSCYLPKDFAELQGAVVAKEFFEYLSRVTDDTVELEITENEIIIKTHNSKAGFVLNKEIKLPLSEVESIDKWVAIPDKFFEAVGMASLNVNSNLSPVINGVHITKEGFIEGTDNYRILQYNLKTKLNINNDFLIPLKNVVKITKYDDWKSFCLTKGWVHFFNDKDVVLSTRVLTEKYPDVNKILEVRGEPINFTEDLSPLVEQAMVFSQMDNLNNELINLDIKDNKISISSKSGYAWFEGELDTEYNGKPFTFNINAKFLKDILNKKYIKSYITEKFIRFESENWVYIAALQVRE